VKSAFRRIDVVGKGEKLFLVGVIVLNGNFHLDIALFAFDHYGFMHRAMPAVQILDKLEQPAVIAEGILLIRSFILDDDVEALVKLGQFPKTPAQGVIIEFVGGEDAHIRLEPDFGACFISLSDLFEFRGLNALFIGLVINRAV